MNEALTSEQIIDISKGWHSKLITEPDPRNRISIKELHALASDVAKIRAAVGLASPRFIGGQDVSLSYGAVNMRIYSSPESVSESINLFVGSSDDDSLPDFQDFLEIFSFAKSPSEEKIGMRRIINFRSRITEAKTFIQGDVLYDDSELSFSDLNTINTLAQTIWKTHLLDHAPLVKQYVPEGGYFKI